MKNVIAQLGERQQFASNLAASNNCPSPAAVKPQPASKKPTGAGAAAAGRVPLKPTVAATTAKPPVSAVKPTSPPNARPPPITAQKPTTAGASRQPVAALVDQAELLRSSSRLKPTVAVKSKVAGASSPSTLSPGSSPSSQPGDDEAAAVPPWQSLVRKKNVPPTPAVKKQASTSGVTQTTALQPPSDSDVQFSPVDTSSADDVQQSHDSQQSSAEGATNSVAAKVRSLKQTFEGVSAEVEQSSKTTSSGRCGTLKKVAAGTSSASASVDETRLSDNKSGQDGAIRDDDRPLPSTAKKDVSKPDLPSAYSSGKSPPRQSISGSTADQQEIVIGVDGRRYRRLPPPGEREFRPGRKPAKPPAVDLTPYRSLGRAPCTSVVPATAVDEDDEIYDDATAVPPLDDGPVTLRSSGGTAGRQNATSAVVSQIAEYTEEEELMERRKWKSGAEVSSPVSESGDDVYDDVAATEACNVLDEYDEVYQELD